VSVVLSTKFRQRSFVYAVSPTQFRLRSYVHRKSYTERNQHRYIRAATEGAYCYVRGNDCCYIHGFVCLLLRPRQWVRRSVAMIADTSAAMFALMLLLLLNVLLGEFVKGHACSYVCS
jgi:hypothetical protein